ncbi:uncharacterized protein LOC125506892 [Triticum urartu]|uniref:uncharacterized protein LOC125506892 n=1 Tax=Triticum urartu TaxID=4572 RepID=UPI002042C4CB|nr:uncharacterized protein LOC125506892 [Triticum urartu]
MDMPKRRTFLADVEAAGEEGPDLDGCHAMEGSSLSLSPLLFLFVQYRCLHFSYAHSVQSSTVLDCCRFVLDEGNYPVNAPLNETIASIQSQVAKIEDGMKQQCRGDGNTFLPQRMARLQPTMSELEVYKI